MPSPSSTPSKDMPEPIDDLFTQKFGDVAPAGPETLQGVVGGAGLSMDNRVPVGSMTPGAGQPPVPGYAEGGLVQPGGAPPPIDTGVTPGGPGLDVPGDAVGEAAEDAAASGEDMEVAAKRILAENPELAQQVIEAAQEGIDSGEFSEELITVGGKMAIVVSRNPDMYPKMYERLTSMGAQSVPPQYDPEFVMTVILMYVAWQQQGGGTGAPEQSDIPSFAQGGYVSIGSKDADGVVIGPGGDKDDLITARLSNGEYVVPAQAVREHGTEHFDKRYKNPYLPQKQSDIQLA